MKPHFLYNMEADVPVAAAAKLKPSFGTSKPFLLQKSYTQLLLEFLQRGHYLNRVKPLFVRTKVESATQLGCLLQYKIINLLQLVRCFGPALGSTQKTQVIKENK